MFDRNREVSKAQLGRAGEVVFGNYMAQQGKIVQYSINQYDDKRDMKIDGTSYEVKTQVPFVFENAFTVKENQLRKLRSVEYIVFVSVPCKNKNHWSAGKVYIIPGSRVDEIVRRRMTKDGRSMVLLPISQMTELFTMSEDNAKILQEYSVSAWN